MAKTNINTNFTKIQTPALLTNSQSIVNQQSHSAYAVYALERYKVCCEDPSQPLFERLWRFHPELLPHVLYNCNLQTILMCRLVSKEFHHAVATCHLWLSYSPFFSKAAISFLFAELYPSIKSHPSTRSSSSSKSSVKEKFEFAKANTEVDVILSINQLLKLPPELACIDQNRLKVILAIKNISELTKLNNRLIKPSNVKLINKIKGLDIIKINPDQITNELLVSISKNLTALPTFTTLAIQNRKNLFHNFPTLTNLTINDTSEKEILNLPNSLKKLHINSAHSISFNLSDSLINLANFTIGVISNDLTLTLPASLSNLINLVIENIYKFDNSPPSMQFKIDAFCNKLTNLFIGKINENVGLTLTSSHALDILNLKIRSIDTCATVTLSNSFRNLTNLEIQCMWRNVTLNCSASMPNLESLTIGYIYKSCTLNFPASMPNLKSITIGSIHIFRSCSLYWPTSMPKLVSLTIGDIFDNESGDIFGNACTFNLPTSMPNLESLTIGNIYSTHVTLSASLPKLKNLTIDGHHATLKLPTTVDDVKIFVIETAHDDAIHKLLTLINDRINTSNTTCCVECCIQ